MICGPCLPAISLGTYWTWLGRRTLRLPVDGARVHTHVLGKTGSGKSYFLAGLFLALHQAGLPATLIDPHGDLAELILTHLLARGDLATEAKRRQLVYLDVRRAEASGYFLPLNVLAQPYSDHAMAEQLAEAARRAWPELASGVPTFENILKHSVIALRQANRPLTDLARLLTNQPFRERVLGHVTDTQVQRFFRDRLDAWGRDGPAMKESTLNRVDLLTLSPLLRAGLGAPDNALDFRHVLDSGTSLLINLSIPYPDTRRLLGCLLTVGMESAALSRADIDATNRQTTHHLLIDEFSQFMAQSEESLTRMLSETRKYHLFCVMAHQNWSQASDRLKGALQNVGLEVIFKAGRVDAEYSARLISQVDPRAVKHTVTDEQAAERTHPTYFPLLEQWETYTQQIQTLRTGQAFIRLPDDTVKRVSTPRLPVVSVPAEELTEVQEYYLHRYFRPLPPPEASPDSREPPGSLSGRKPATPLPISPLPTPRRAGTQTARAPTHPTRPTGTVYARPPRRRTRRS